MPINRIDLKEKAKVAFKANYSSSVVAALVLTALTAVLVGTNVNVMSTMQMSMFPQQLPEQQP